MADLPISRLANAFYPHATASVTGVVGVGPAVYAAKKALGGLWVGGRVTISDEGVRFAANGLNKVMHKNAPPIDIPLDTIKSVKLDGGWITRIVSVEHAGGELRFRCYGASKIVATLNKRLAVG